MKFSTIIPLYNKEKYIKRAVISVLKASKGFQNEIIVIDDGSTDKGPEIVQRLILKYSCLKLITQKNKGVSAARNRGVSESNGKYISLLDADDEWKNNHLKIIDNLIEKYPTANIFASAYKVVNARSKKEIETDFHNCPAESGLLKSFFNSATFGNSPICSSNMCISKNVYDLNNGYDEEETLGEDIDFLSRLAVTNNIAWSSKVGVIRYIRSKNNSIEIANRDRIWTFFSKKKYKQDHVSKEEEKYFPLFLLKRALSEFKWHFKKNNFSKIPYDIMYIVVFCFKATKKVIFQFRS